MYSTQESRGKRKENEPSKDPKKKKNEEERRRRLQKKFKKNCHGVAEKEASCE